MATFLELLAAGVTDSNGSPLASGRAYFYVPGSLTQRAVYEDEDGTYVLSQPVALDAGGRATVYTMEPVRLVVEDYTGATVYDLGVAGSTRDAQVEVSSSSFTDSYLNTVLDKWLAANRGQDWKLQETATSEPYAAPDWNRDLLINVKRDHGAAGNGTIDDYAAIQAAIDRVIALGGGTVYIPKGTYRLATSPAVATSGVPVRVCGAGPAATVLYPVATMHGLVGSDADDLCVEDLSVTNSTGTPALAGEGLRLFGCRGVNLRRVTTSNVLDGLRIEEGTRSFKDIVSVGCNWYGINNGVNMGNGCDYTDDGGVTFIGGTKIGRAHV